jgi:3-phenylpropionate/trans-cinnamate dioxygenase ferredoxin component
VIVSEWIKVADATDLALNCGLRVVIDDEAVALWNVDGEIFATSDTCTHEEASLSEGWLEDGTIECPLHGARYDARTGAVLSLPAVFPIATFPVKVEGDSVYVGWKSDEG